MILLKSALTHALYQVIQQDFPDQADNLHIDDRMLHLTRPSHAKFGDYTTNIALTLAKTLRTSPRALAEKITHQLRSQHLNEIESIDIAGPGHINFLMTFAYRTQILADVFTQGDQYGTHHPKHSPKVLIEFVSANPTGPLHVGHGRGAAYGASLANLLEAAGCEVTREYYVNDAGRQMNILALSVWLRFLQGQHPEILLPSNAYQGEYIVPLSESAAFLNQQQPLESEDIHKLTQTPDDAAPAEVKEHHLDSLIERCQQHLGSDLFKQLKQHALDHILEDIRDDLADFGVHYDHWFSESQLHTSGDIQSALDQLDKAGYLYQKGGATWFRSTHFGDDKDRVVLRENNQATYFAADIAYHAAKYRQGYDLMINIWGADHHGYIARVKAAIQALQLNKDQLTINLVQFANLIEKGERISMSTRSGQFITLRALREQVGKDATRFFYVQRQADQHMDFDISLAQSHTKDNPVYYIQYAHARANSIIEQTGYKQHFSTDDTADNDTHLYLSLETEQALLKSIADYPLIVQQAVEHHQPHQIAQYLLDLASHFHSYYNATRILVDEPALCQARTRLIMAIKQVIANGLGMLGVSAPNSM